MAFMLCACKSTTTIKNELCAQFPNSEISAIDPNRWIVRMPDNSVVYAEYNGKISTNTIFGKRN